jgi:hypothetical protein
MNARKSKLFRKIFAPDNKRGWREFKRAYARAPLAQRLELIATAQKMKGKTIHRGELPNGG